MEDESFHLGIYFDMVVPFAEIKSHRRKRSLGGGGDNEFTLGHNESKVLVTHLCWHWGLWTWCS